MNGEEPIPFDRWARGEPVVVRLRAGNHHLIAGHPVQFDRLALLRLVPHQHAVRHFVNESLGRQVIPAADAQNRFDPEQPRRPDVIDLVRSEIQQRRQQHEVGLDASEHISDLRRRRQDAVDSVKQADEQCAAGARAEDGQAADRHGKRGRLFGGAAAKLRRVVPSRVEIPPVIERRPDASPKRIPEPVPARRHELVLDGRMVRFEAVDHLLAVDCIGPLGDDVDRVAALREQTDGRLKVPEEPEAGDREEDLHQSDGLTELINDPKGLAGPYRLPPSHLQRGAHVSSAHTTTYYLERRS
jgi:hypothetical protein